MHEDSMRFYDALPKRKAELVDGQMYLGGSLTKSAMALGYMVEQLGAEYVVNLVPHDLLANAVQEVYGKNQHNLERLADFDPVEPFHSLPGKMAYDLLMGLFMEDVYVCGGTQAIKLGEEIFMPDVYILTGSSAKRQREYYLDGAPDLVMEISIPFMREFDFGIRLDRYAKAGLPEVWMIDFERRTFQPMVLENGQYTEILLTGEVFYSQTIAGFGIEHGKIFDSVEEFGMHPLSIYKIPELLRSRRNNPFRREKERRTRFAPRFALQPVPIDWKEFIYWGGEVKFEMDNGKPIFGGGYETTEEWLGLLIMTLGLVRTVKYLPAEEWSKVL